MIKEIVEFVNVNKGIEQYIDTKIDGIFIYLKYDNNSFNDVKIIKGKHGVFNYYSINTNKLLSLKFNKERKGFINLQKNNLNGLFDIERNDLEIDIQRILYYAKIYSKGKNNNFQALNKIKSLDSTSPFFMKIPFDYNGQHISFYKEDKKIEKQRDIIENINAHILKATEYIEDNEEYIEFLKMLRDKVIYEINKIKNSLLLKSLLEEELNNKKDKESLIQETIYLCIDVGKDRQLEFDKYYLREKAFNKKRDEMRFSIGQCGGCGRENKELSAQFLFTNYDNTFAYKNLGLDYNFVVCQDCAISLIKFWELAKQNISNPLPLIIYKNKEEKGIFGETFRVLDEREKLKTYQNVIKEIYYKNPKSLKNYYLFNFKFNGPQKKLFSNDIDYIENFKYMTDFRLYNFLNHFNHKYKKTVKDIVDMESFYNRKISIFQFEKIVSELIFEDKLLGNYFSDYKKLEIKYSKLKSPKNSNSNNILKNYLIKYRQNFYEFIYKSYQSAIGLIDFREMLLDIIIDNIKHDEKNKDGFSVYENEIKEKLNFLFSIENYLKEKKLDSDELMNLKDELKQSLGWWEEYKDKDKIKNRFVGGIDHIELKDENNKLFAYLVGQFARYMLSLSKAKKENLTHADFAGFLDWHDSRLLKGYVLDIFQKYAHEFRYSSQNGKVENAVSIIQSYKEDLKMDSVKEYLIAGYFADNYFYEKTEKLEEEENE